jgi:hypothetical protein
MRVVPAVLAFTLALTACGSGGAPGSASEEVARDYVQAINARDGERVCGLMTEAVADEFSASDGSLSCDQTVTGLVGYVEDAGMAQFLQYRLVDVRPGATEGDYSSVHMSLDARRRSSSAAQAFESCRIDDTLWLTREDGELRIAKPSLALYVAAGASTVQEEVLAPPGVDVAASNDQPLDCVPEQGVKPDAGAPEQTPAALAALLDGESDQVSDVRCFDADGSDGWDVVCTYFDARLGERMKSGYRWGPNSAIMSGGSVPANMHLPAAPAE